MTRADVQFGLKIVATLIALFGVGKYFADRAAAVEGERRAKSLGYIEAYAGPEMVKTRDILFQFWKRNEEYLAHIEARGTTTRAYAQFARVALEEDRKTDDLQGALFRLANFYDQVWHCRHGDLCNHDMLDDYFCGRVNLQAVAYGPFLDVLGRRSGFDSFGSSLEHLNTSCSE